MNQKIPLPKQPNRITKSELKKYLQNISKSSNDLHGKQEPLHFLNWRRNPKGQITKLFGELKEVKENHTPGMKYFMGLERTVKQMEYKQRKQDLKQPMEHTHQVLLKTEQNISVSTQLHHFTDSYITLFTYMHFSPTQQCISSYIYFHRVTPSIHSSYIRLRATYFHISSLHSHIAFHIVSFSTQSYICYFTCISPTHISLIHIPTSSISLYPQS